MKIISKVKSGGDDQEKKKSRSIIPMSKKKKIRDMRGDSKMQNPDGTVSSHRMSWVGDPSKKRGEFGVYPTVKPKEGKESSTDPKDWTTQTPSQAIKSGEFIDVKSRRKAEKLAGGSWKK